MTTPCGWCGDEEVDARSAVLGLAGSNPEFLKNQYAPKAGPFESCEGSKDMAAVSMYPSDFEKLKTGKEPEKIEP